MLGTFGIQRAAFVHIGAVRVLATLVHVQVVVVFDYEIVLTGQFVVLVDRREAEKARASHVRAFGLGRLVF